MNKIKTRLEEENSLDIQASIPVVSGCDRSSKIHLSHSLLVVGKSVTVYPK